MLAVLVWYHGAMPSVPQAGVLIWKRELLNSLNFSFNLSGFLHTLKAFQVCEFFAGDGNLSKTAKYGMIACAKLDLEYGKTTARIHKQNAFDLLQPAGLAFLDILLTALRMFQSHPIFCGLFCTFFLHQVSCVGPSQWWSKWVFRPLRGGLHFVFCC